LTHRASAEEAIMHKHARNRPRSTRTRLTWKALKWPALGLLLLVGPAQATFHLIKIVEIFPGTPAAPQAQYVVLQAYAAGQNLVGGHALTVFNATGGQIASFTFSSNVTNGANQMKVLIGTPQAETFLGVQANLEITAQMLQRGGKVCWAGTIDCVSWGNYSGSTAGVGSPFSPASGLSSTRAALRRLNISGGATTLEATDDTGNSANDFAFGALAPRNNAGMLGHVPAATCGNNRTEGLEQCDDGGNTAAGDMCNSTCTAGIGAYRAQADFNNDGRSDVPWRNNTSGANTLWRSAYSPTVQSVTAITSTAWRIVGVGDFDNSGTADLLWRNMSTGANVIWRSANSATQTAVTAVSNLQFRVVGVGDFDADGRADIAWRNDTTGADVIWRSGNSATTIAVATQTGPWRIVGVGDFNKDGRADLLWRNTTTGANAIWRSGLNTMPTAVATLATAWSVAGVGDFSGDRADDILWRNVSTGANAIWRSGSSATQTAVTSQSGNSWRVVAVADYNGDRRDDILWRNFSTGANMIWRSGNSALLQTMTSQASQAWQVAP